MKNKGNSLKPTPIKRRVAFFTLLCFLTANLNLTGLPSLTASTITAADTLNSKNFFESVNLPASLGQVKSSFHGSRDEIILYVQDAHANEEAQRNIAGIIDYFSKKSGLHQINLEGAQGELFTELYSFFPNKKARQTISDYFLKEARLTGPEYLALVENPGIKLMGVEDLSLYNANRQAYREAFESKNQDAAALAGLGKTLDSVSRFVFSPDMLELVRLREGFEKNGHQLVAYAKYLSEAADKLGIPIQNHQTLNSLLSLIGLEKNLNTATTEKELENFLRDFKKIISRERVSIFLANTARFRAREMKKKNYYLYLEKEIADFTRQQKDDRFQKKYSSALNYLHYLRLENSIGPEIFSELQSLEETLKPRLFRSNDEMQLDHFMRVFSVYQKLFGFNLNQEDVDFFYGNRKDFNSSAFAFFLKPLLQKNHFAEAMPSDFSILDRDLPLIEKFYEVALKRDNQLIANSIQNMFQGKQKISALVTGGFHTPGIEKYLQAGGYSYLVITPNISKEIDTEKENSLYQEALLTEKMPLQKTLAESFWRSSEPDTQFQLSPWHILLSRAEAGKVLADFSQLSNQAAVEKYLAANPQNAVSLFLLQLLAVENTFQDGSIAPMLKSLEAEIQKAPDTALSYLAKVLKNGEYFSKNQAQVFRFRKDTASGKSLIAVRYPENTDSAIKDLFRNKPERLALPGGDYHAGWVDDDILNSVIAIKTGQRAELRASKKNKKNQQKNAPAKTTGITWLENQNLLLELQSFQNKSEWTVQDLDQLKEIKTKLSAQLPAVKTFFHRMLVRYVETAEKNLLGELTRIGDTYLKIVKKEKSFYSEGKPTTKEKESPQNRRLGAWKKDVSDLEKQITDFERRQNTELLNIKKIFTLLDENSNSEFSKNSLKTLTRARNEIGTTKKRLADLKSKYDNQRTGVKPKQLQAAQPQGLRISAPFFTAIAKLVFSSSHLRNFIAIGLFVAVGMFLANWVNPFAKNSSSSKTKPAIVREIMAHETQEPRERAAQKKTAPALPNEIVMARPEEKIETKRIEVPDEKAADKEREKLIWGSQTPIDLTKISPAEFSKIAPDQLEQLRYLLNRHPQRDNLLASTGKNPFISHTPAKSLTAEQQKEFEILKPSILKFQQALKFPVDDVDYFYPLDWYTQFFRPYFAVSGYRGQTAKNFIDQVAAQIPARIAFYNETRANSKEDFQPYRWQTVAPFLSDEARLLHEDRWKRIRHQHGLSNTTDIPLTVVLGDAFERAQYRIYHSRERDLLTEDGWNKEIRKKVDNPQWYEIDLFQAKRPSESEEKFKMRRNTAFAFVNASEGSSAKMLNVADDYIQPIENARAFLRKQINETLPLSRQFVPRIPKDQPPPDDSWVRTMTMIATRPKTPIIPPRPSPTASSFQINQQADPDRQLKEMQDALMNLSYALEEQRIRTNYSLAMMRWDNNWRFDDVSRTMKKMERSLETRIRDLELINAPDNRFANSFLFYILTHRETWKNPDGESFADVFDRGKMQELVYNFNALWESGAMQSLYEPELGKFLLEFIDQHHGGYNPQRHSLNMTVSLSKTGALSEGKEAVAKLAVELRSRFNTLPPDIRTALEAPLSYYEMQRDWIKELKNKNASAQIIRGNEDLLDIAGGVLYSYTLESMTHFYVGTLVEVGDSYRIGATSTEQIIARTRAKADLLPTLNRYYGRTLRPLSDPDDAGRLTSVANEVILKNIPTVLMQTVYRIAEKRQTQNEALQLFRLIRGAQIEKLDLLNPVDHSFLIFWAMEGNSDNFQQWRELFKDPEKRQAILELVTRTRRIWSGNRPFNVTERPDEFQAGYNQVLEELKTGDLAKSPLLGTILAKSREAIQDRAVGNDVVYWENWLQNEKDVLEILERGKEAELEKGTPRPPAPLNTEVGPAIPKIRSELRLAVSETSRLKLRNLFNQIHQKSKADNLFEEKFINQLLNTSKTMDLPYHVSRTANASRAGYVILNYDPAVHGMDFIKQAVDQIRGLGGVKLAIFAEASALTEINTQFAADKKTGLLLTPKESVDQFISLKLQEKELGISSSEMIQVFNNADSPSQTDRKFVRAALLGAVPLSQGTIVILGIDEERIGRAHILEVTRIFENAFKALKAIQQSA